MKSNLSVIFIGGSAGGIKALQQLLHDFGNRLPLPIIVVQHLPANAKVNPELVYGSFTQKKLVEIMDKTSIEKNHVYFGPPGYHTLIESDGTLSLSRDELVHHSRPSIDVLFESAAQAYGQRAVGILMTGANADGANGLKLMKECGALTFVQDPIEAEFPMMPSAAINIMKPDYVSGLSDIAKKLIQNYEGT